MTKTMTKKQQLLTVEEERELIHAAHSGSRKALSELMKRNQGLVHSQVQRFPLKNAQVSYDDLWQQGCMGFLHAVELFEPERGLRLSTYAYRWIHAYIRRYFQNQGRVVRLPAHLADRKFQLDREAARLTQSLGRTPSREELDELVPGYNELNSTFAHTVSLNLTLESGDEVLDVQADPTSTDAEIEVGVLLDQLKTRVSERDYNIFVTRYGVDGHTEQTLQQVADEFDLTRARIHQVTAHCVQVLRTLAR